MAFEPKKFNEIVDEMQGRITGLTDFEVGSVTRTLVETFSYELGLLYEKMRLVYLSAFIDSAEGSNLDQVVAILGISRGLPDYSTGVVSFERDRGNNEILIPLGTLIATEDSPNKPKKVYQTIEEKIMQAADTFSEVKVQALERGEEQDALAGEIVVMPRPLPGIKGVNNKDSVKLTGKQREKDEELRERSKNALISAGKATILSIENTLLSQPEVLDVKVREDFLFPQGAAVITRKAAFTEDITIPRYSQVKAMIDGNNVILRTKSEVFIKAGLNESTVIFQAEKEGKSGELSSVQLNGISWQFVKPEFGTMATIGNLQPIVLSDFGVIDVFVDGPDLDKPDQRKRMVDAIDRVKAAGIYVRLEAAKPLYFDGIFLIDPNKQQNLTEEELLDLEGKVTAAIKTFLNQTKMGETLLFSKMLKEVLAVEGVENLAAFEIYTEALRYGGVRKLYKLGDNKIENEEAERFKYRDINVAAGTKKLPLDLEIQVDGLDKAKFEALQSNFNDYTKNLEVGKKSIIAELLAALKNGVAGVHDNTLFITPRPWSPRTHLFVYDKAVPPKQTEVDVSFVEKAEAGRLFAYSSFLEITGALRILLAPNIPLSEASAISTAATNTVKDFLNALGPEEDIILEQVVLAVKKVNGVSEVEWDADDFRAELLTGATRISVADRINKGKCEVNPFEKTRLRPNAFCIAFRNELVNVEVTSLKLQLQSKIPVDAAGNAIRAELKTLTANIISNFLNTSQPGDDLDFNALRTSIENRLPSAPAIVQTLAIKAVSAADGREQTASISNPVIIHIRTVELAKMKPITAANVILLEPA